MQHPTAILSDIIGVPESTLRLIITILLAYPVAAGFRSLYSNKPNQQKDDQTKEDFTRTLTARNRYILISGLSLASFFGGWTIAHGVVTLAVSYGLCLAFQRQRTMAVTLVWIFNAAYLLTGYYTKVADDYDISWTMPQCIICLRLMGFSMDFMDGDSSRTETTTTTTTVTVTTTTLVKDNDNNKPSSSTTTVKKVGPAPRPLSFGANSALTTLPPFTQVAAYCFYPSSFLIGPQFSFSLYHEWLLFYNTQDPDSSSTKSRQQMQYVLQCFGWAVFYLAMQQLVGSHFPTSYLLTSDYASLGPLYRFGIFWVSGKFVFIKYLGVWLLTEGATALFGIGYEGINSEGRHSFAGLANVNPIKYETATSLEHIISSFNINTNFWSKYYVFKRLRWMGSKTGSQTGTLAFLAIWHGFHYGYFSTFLLEFLDVLAEGILRKWVALVPFPDRVTWIKNALAWFVCSSTLYYAGVGFDLLTFSSSWAAYRQVFFYGHVGLVILFASSFLLPLSKKVVVTVHKNKKE
ncbi:MBOAT, membrane-bound O-acyltransferase family-domain-containing protein [Chlamydoabsidia padenii]|nr:MBOAT, membrane-bound O-acyltransferase family-domain-containing protein [Chlamydoabsidia padenii]